MKTKLLFSAMVLIGLTSATTTATAVNQGEDLINTARYRYAEPITFIERGVEFLIFPDGSFDFNSNLGNSLGNLNESYNDSYYYRNTNARRSSVNTTQGAPGTVRRSNYNTPIGGGVLIQHDFDGKVRRIGNVFINYDRDGKVKRVGTVYMNYNRGGLLTQVGGLRITYNSWGEIINSSGVVNYNNSNYNTGQGYGSSYGTNYNDFEDNEDYYYYRQGDKVLKQEKLNKSVVKK
ncbi:MAG: hypothetical protein ACSHXF_14400 [Aquaticitalea sp.]